MRENLDILMVQKTKVYSSARAASLQSRKIITYTLNFAKSLSCASKKEIEKKDKEL